MPSPLYPSLYQINTRVWLHELASELRRPATFDDISNHYLDWLAAQNFDWVWPLGVWQTGAAARAVSRNHSEWRRGFLADLPDLTAADITGSPFAIQAYRVHPDFGGEEALGRFRDRLRQRGIKLVLDFVPNHTAPDHPWVFEFPDYYIVGSADDLAREPHNYLQVETQRGPRILAHGRDAYSPGWPDTLQLNYRTQDLRDAMLAELLGVAQHCDGVRCDMAMLLLPTVIERTWGERSLPTDGTAPVDTSFWPEAILRIRTETPQFLFMAEVYRDLEWDLQQQGFDYTYDKRLYDRLRAAQAEAVRGHLWADLGFQSKSVRFLENHDEPRAAAAFPPGIHQAAAVIAFLIPGLRFFHEGQFEGRRQRVALHLGRRQVEAVDSTLHAFYLQLLATVQLSLVREGRWRLLDCVSAWNGNSSFKNFLAWTWDNSSGPRLLVTVNYAPARGQCYVRLPWPDLSGKSWCLRDRLGEAVYHRAGNELAGRGLYLDLSEWQYHVFEVLAG